MFNKHSYKHYTYLPLILGLITGVLIYIIKIIFDSSNDIYFIEDKIIDLCKSLDMEYNSSLYFFNQRIIVVVAFLIVQLIFSYYFASAFFNYIFGIYYIIISVNIIIIYGFDGLILIACLFLPHFIFYYYAVCLLGKWFFCNETSYNNIYERFNNINFFVKIIIIILMLLAGVLFEYFFQKNFLIKLPIYCS